MKKLVCTLFIAPFLAVAQQLPGDEFFAVNQVIRVDFTFTQTGFWDSLVANYPLEQDMMAASMVITDVGGVHNLDSVAIRLKGNSSYGHPGNKKSFKLDLNQWVLGQDYDGLKKMNFNNGFKDPTFMREKLYFDMCNALGIYAPRVNYANVYMNGTFWGFYTVVEQVDDQFLDWTTIDDTGNLFKAGDNTNGTTAADLMYYGAAASSYYSRYELKTNEALNDWSDLIALINFINNSSATDFEANFNTNINKSMYLRSMAMDNLFSSLDSYLNSARNYYLYHNQTTGQWEWIKWDGNEAFGVYSGPGLGNLQQLAPNYSASNRPLLSKMLANTNLYAEYKNYMCSIIETHFNSTYFDAKAEELKTLIQDHVAADNNKMYTTQNFIDNIENDITVSGGMGNQTMFGLKSFVATRNAYLTGILNCQTGLGESLLADFTVYPNPFEQQVVFSDELKVISMNDVTGKEVAFQVLNQDGLTIVEVPSDVKAGLYFITLQAGTTTKTVQLIKE